jgi:hypothetical protein
LVFNFISSLHITDISSLSNEYLTKIFSILWVVSFGYCFLWFNVMNLSIHAIISLEIRILFIKELSVSSSVFFMFFCSSYNASGLKFRYFILNWLLHKVRDRDLFLVFSMLMSSFPYSISWRAHLFFNICFLAPFTWL